MAVIETKENSPATSAKPEETSGDRTEDKKVADHAIADPQKLLVDSFPSAKSPESGNNRRAFQLDYRHQRLRLQHLE